MSLNQENALRFTGVLLGSDNTMSSAGSKWRSLLSRHRKYVIIVVTPLLLLPVLVRVDDLKGRCAYMMMLMAVYWVTEAIPLAATGLIPIFLAPSFGLLTSTQVAGNYMKNVMVLLVGGLFVAAAIEKSNLHKRIALAVLRVVGTTPKWLMLGFMLPTFLCSMFISNTATTAMMLPIMEAVMEQLGKASAATTAGPQAPDDRNAISPSNNPGFHGEEIDLERQTKTRDGTACASLATEETTGSQGSMMPLTNHASDVRGPNKTRYTPQFLRMCQGMTLCVCYTANVGGTATLTGSPPNLILKGFADDIWASKGLGESPISYSSWIAFALPIALINFGLIYMWLLVFYLGHKSLLCKQYEDPNQKAAVKEIINRDYKKLGSITYAEVTVTVLFTLLVFLWFFRYPGFISGWSRFFADGYVSDAAPAVFIAVLLFSIPLSPPIPWEEQPRETAPALLTWDDIHDKFPWGLLFLMGGGFALAHAAEESGLSTWIGDQLSVFGNLPDWLMVATICLLVAMVTEVTSNSATCTVLMPVMASMAETLGRNPLYLMLPTAISTSYAFMLPVATPPNAIAFSHGRLEVIDMIKGGAILNFLCVFSVTLATQTWGFPLFGFSEIPWDNTTAHSPTPFRMALETTTFS